MFWYDDSWLLVEKDQNDITALCIMYYSNANTKCRGPSLESSQLGAERFANWAHP